MTVQTPEKSGGSHYVPHTDSVQTKRPERCANSNPGLTDHEQRTFAMASNPNIPDAGNPQPFPVIACNAGAAAEWFAILQLLMAAAQDAPALTDSPAWRETYAYAQSRWESAFEVLG